ncbi:MAG: BON domain-containing protein, partial [Polyangiales bacterium]
AARRRGAPRSKARSLPTRRRRNPRLVQQPSVLVFGMSSLAKRITERIRRKGARCERVEKSGPALASIDETTRAIFVVPPIPKVSVAAYVSRVRDREDPPPVFVVLEGPLPPRAARDLYRAGIEAAFELPLDAGALERTVFRLAGAARSQWGRKKRASEIAIEEQVRTRLKADATHFGPKLRLNAHRRFVILEGVVDALWKLELAIQIVSETPGVEDVLGDAVDVQGEPRSDRAIASAVRTVLQHASSIEPSTLAVAVRDGVVVLTGTAVDRRELARALQLVGQVHGVRKIDNYVAVSVRGKQQDRTVARRVTSALRARFPDADVEVAVFGGIAVVSGTVERASTRLAIGTLISNQDGVGRVVDKLDVAKR